MKSVTPVQKARRMIERGSRIKPRLRFVQNISFLLLFATYSITGLLLLLPPFSLIDPILSRLGIKQGGGSPSLYELGMVGCLILASFLPTVAMWAFLKRLYVRVGLMTNDEAREFLPIDDLPDSWLGDDLPEPAWLTRAGSLVGVVWLLFALGGLPVLYAWLHYVNQQ